MYQTLNHSPMYDTILKRYQKGYITDEQLEKYLKLKKITEEEYNIIKNSPKDSEL